MNREQSRGRSNGDLSIIFLVSKTFYVQFSVSIVGRCKKIFKKKIKAYFIIRKPYMKTK